MALNENVFSCSWQKDFGIHKVQAQLWQFCKNMTPENHRVSRLWVLDEVDTDRVRGAERLG